MKYSFAILILVTLLLFSCKRNIAINEIRNVKRTVQFSDSFYPEIVIKHGLEKEFDKAKFEFYLLSAFDTPRVRFNGTYAFEPAKPLAAYPVILDTLFVDNDSPIFIFSFIINGEKMTDSIAWSKEVNFVEAVYHKHDNELHREVTCVRTIGYSDVCPEMVELCFRSFDNKYKFNVSRDSIDRIFTNVVNRMGLLENPTTLAFIQSNHKDLNPWFVKIARQKGIIKD